MSSSATFLVSLVLAQGAAPPVDLHPELPPASDRSNFPAAYDRSFYCKQVQRHDQHIAYLEQYQALYPGWRDQVSVWLEETRLRRLAWDALWDVHLTRGQREDNGRQALAYR
jgi:hypothetical protein